MIKTFINSNKLDKNNQILKEEDKCNLNNMITHNKI